MDNVNFIDLIALMKIKPDTPVEKFGAEINASFFDSSNILGGLRTKGLVDFSVNFPDQNKIQLTDAGKQLLQDAEDKSTAEFDLLDMEILTQLSGTKRDITDISNTLNIRPVDLAFRLYKLLKGNYISYNFKNANIEIMLTEIGFIKVKLGLAQQNQGQTTPPQAAAPAVAQNAPQSQNNSADPEGTAQANDKTALPPNQIYTSFENKVKQIKLVNKNILIISIVIVLFILFLLFRSKIVSLI